MNTVQQTAKSAQDIAQQIAKQLRNEPSEILKTAGEQVFGTEAPKQPENQTSEQPKDEQQKKLEEQQKIQDNMKSSRLMEAFRRELEDISKQDLFKDLQGRISAGEIIPLEDYAELTMDQRQVLKAQMEAVKNQMAKQSAGGKSLEISTTKKSRRFGTTQKQEAEKQQARVEKPVPPSG